MRKYLVLILLSTLAIGGFAQKKGSLRVNQDNRVERLMRRQRDVYSVSKTMPGYRIQIFMEIGNDAINHAQSVKYSFTRAFPEIPVYLSYEQPYYRLRVGDFRSRIEAEKYLRLIKPKFSLAFVTTDVINPPEKLDPVDLEELIDQGEDLEGD